MLDTRIDNLIEEASIETPEKLVLLRYPGGKQRQLPGFIDILPSGALIAGRYIEPFVGGASVFFSLNPRRAILNDLNKELIDLYHGIQQDPIKLWKLYKEFPSSRDGYYEIRNAKVTNLDPIERAARTLYLNRTCFKGMWRHNASGAFNVGYGGEDRRWVISDKHLLAVSLRLRNVQLSCCDFGEVVETCTDGDFIFLDPPYKPGDKDLLEYHYQCGQFLFKDQERLAQSLQKASRRGTKWAMTNSSHPEIVALYQNCTILTLSRGTGSQPGRITDDPVEVIIRNY